MKIKYELIATAAVLTILLMTSCNKFLDVKPKGKQLLVTVSDYNLWLNSPNLTYENDAYNTYFFSDLVDRYPFTLTSTAVADLEYQWAPQFNDKVTTPAVWSGIYANIYYYNVVINGIDKATDGSQSQKNALKGEALLGRALEYFYLGNLYGKVYNPATANQDLAVPFVTSSDIVDKTPPRSTEKELYSSIIADLNQAIAYLPPDNASNRYRGSVSAAYSVLARIYFYMADYSNAQKYALLALAAPSVTMLDYNTGVTSPTAYPKWPLLSTRKDAIYARGAADRSYAAYTRITLAFANSFAPGDLRGYFIKDYGLPTLSSNPARGSVMYCFSIDNAGNCNIGTSAAEMKLIIAEAAARSGDLTTALNQLDDVRKNRFTPAQYAKFQSNDQAAVLQKILDERVFELPFAGLRWFDMRRLNAEGKMPVVYRYDNTGAVFATLKKNDPRYVLQIPLNVLSFNPDMPQNP